MKSIVLFAALCLSSAAIAQPTDVDIINWYNRQKAKPEFAGIRRNLELKNMYLNGNFSAKGTQECVVMVPVVVDEKQKGDYLILMQKARAGWMDSYLLNKIVDDIRLYDVDKDGLMEVWTEQSGMGQGNMETTYELTSFKALQTKVLFSSKAFDLTAGSAYTMEPGAVVAREVDIRLEDLDKDGKMEISEKVVTKILVSADIDAALVKTESTEKTIVYRLSDDMTYKAEE